MDQPMELVYELADKLGIFVESTPQRAAESVPQNDLARLTELLQRIGQHINRPVDEQQVFNLDLKITSCGNELTEHEASIEHDRRILEEEAAKNIKRNAELKKALEEQKKADENLRRLLEEQKREKELSFRKVNEIEGRIRKDRGNKVLGRENVDDVQQKLKEIEKKLAEKQQELDDLRQSYRELISKERRTNDELQEARKAQRLLNMQSSSPVNYIGIKRMGEIDEKEFKNVCENRFPHSLSGPRGKGLYASLQEKIKNPEWHPFRIVEDKTPNHRTVINEDDETLKGLRKGWGPEIYSLVTTALMELQDYNASGRDPVFELWNHKENRKATTKEVIEYMLTHQEVA